MYPVQVDLDAPLEVPRWRPLVSWLLAVPHIFVLWLLGVALGIVAFISWFAILFTGNIPEGLFGFEVAVLRYQWRVSTYLFWMRTPYPPFEVATVGPDPGNDPARFSVERPERLSRGLIFIKWLLVIPHAIVLFFLAIAVCVAGIIAFFAVLITGKWPPALRDFAVGVSRWSLRVNAYTYLLTDAYPPFSLD